MKWLFNSCYLLLMLVTIQLHVTAQERRAAELEPGDAAPPIAIQKWALGDGISGFEKGKFYLLELTSMYCQPCMEVMPHIREVTGKYKGRLKVVSIFEAFRSTADTGYLDYLNAFLDKERDSINYAVGIDEPGSVTIRKWLHAIHAPAAFIIDGQGKIAWAGNPAYLDDRLINGLLNRKPGVAVAAPEKGAFEKTVEGQTTHLYYIKNKKGNFKAALTNYGARLVYLQAPDKKGAPVSVVAGFDSLSAYQDYDPYSGATIGRVVNRLSKTKLVLEGQTSNLRPNYGPALIHGGMAGYQEKIWEGKQIDDGKVEFTLLSPDGDGGFPGNLQVKVTYSIEKDETLRVTYEATTDKPTIVNLSNHIYFNLNGEGSGNINNHLLTMNADKYTPVDGNKFPKGTIEPVDGTPLDFRKPMTIGERIEEKNDQLRAGRGYDHNFVLIKSATDATGLTPAMTVTGDKSGITMQISTTEPGIQLYTGNGLAASSLLRSGFADSRRSAFVAEPQHFPDAPNQPVFPSIELKPGEKYHSETTFIFSQH